MNKNLDPPRSILQRKKTKIKMISFSCMCVCVFLSFSSFLSLTHPPVLSNQLMEAKKQFLSHFYSPSPSHPSFSAISPWNRRGIVTQVFKQFRVCICIVPWRLNQCLAVETPGTANKAGCNRIGLFIQDAQPKTIFYRPGRLRPPHLFTVYGRLSICGVWC